MRATLTAASVVALAGAGAGPADAGIGAGWPQRCFCRPPVRRPSGAGTRRRHADRRDRRRGVTTTRLPTRSSSKERP
jgi:hypothetical protein